MKRFSQLFLIFTVALLLIWQIPWWYNFFAARPAKIPFALYSTVAGEFLSFEQMQDKKSSLRDRSGRIYTQEQADTLLPFFYMRQLIADERFPDKIKGITVTPRDVQNSNFSFRIAPSDLNAPKIGLYPLLESMSGRVELSMPDDVFRITPRGIEFVRVESNTIDTEKSMEFTRAMNSKGFAFPAREISGNPTTRKEYDEGYLLLDAEGKLFHLKQMRGRPYVRPIPLPEGFVALRIFLTEFKSRGTLGFVTDIRGKFHVIDRKNYTVRETGIPAYRPGSESLSIIGNMFDWTVCIRKPEAVAYYALDAEDYSLVDSIRFPLRSIALPGLSFTSTSDKYVRPRLSR